MTELNGKTPDIAEENITMLKEIFPDVFEEGKVDFDKLKQVLGDYVDDNTERYNFSWNGKGRALRLAQSPSTGTLRPCPEESKDWDTTQNIYVEGDNLEVLKLLQKSYHSKVKMIYIDPPYNTGGDFVYPDDYSDSMENYLRITGQKGEDGAKISTNTESSGRYHTDWLNMMYPRLRLARNLLTDDGVIFISIDDNEVDNLKKICNEVFGEDNFIAQFVWKSKAGGDDRAVTGISNNHEYILAFYKLNILPFLGVEKAVDNFSNPDNDPRGLWRSCDMTGLAPKEARPNLHYDLVNPETQTIYSCPPLGWAYSKDRMKKEINEGKVLWPKTENGRPRHKLFLLEINQFKAIPSVITDFTTGDGTRIIKNLFEKRIFDFPKTPRLMHLFTEQITAKDDIILDFFSGSATTAHAVMQLNAEDGGNRKFIMVQLPEPCDEKSEAYKAGYKNICEIGKERIRRAGDKIKDESGLMAQNLDIGFKVFKLDTSNVKKWNAEAVFETTEEKQLKFNAEKLEEILQNSISNFVAGRTETDVVYEIMVKMGLDLTYPVEEIVFDGKKVYSVALGALMICLDDNISTAVAEGMVKLNKEKNPETWKVVFKDNGFKDDSAKTNVREILKCAGLDEDAFTTL